MRGNTSWASPCVWLPSKRGRPTRQRAPRCTRFHALVSHFGDELRTICAGDRGTAPNGCDLLSTLEKMMKCWEREVGIPVRFDWETTDLAEIDDAVAEAVFRLVQEALTNVAKHASNASRVVVQLRVEPDALKLTVNDDCLAMNGQPNSALLNQREHCGISGMRERVVELGGHFDVRHQAQKGTSVVAMIPLRTCRAPTVAVSS